MAYPRLSSLSNVTESGNIADGWSYTYVDSSGISYDLGDTDGVLLDFYDGGSPLSGSMLVDLGDPFSIEGYDLGSPEDPEEGFFDGGSPSSGSELLDLNAPSSISYAAVSDVALEGNSSFSAILTQGPTGYPGLGLDQFNTVGNASTFDYLLYANFSENSYSVSLNNIQVVNSGASIVPEEGDILRWRRENTTLYAEISKDDGVTYSVVHTLPNQPVYDLYPKISFAGQATLGPLSINILSATFLPISILYGTVLPLSGSVSRTPVIVRLISSPYTDVGITTAPFVVYSDDDGYFEIPVVQGTTIEVVIRRLGFRRTMTVPVTDSNVLDLS